MLSARQIAPESLSWVSFGAADPHEVPIDPNGNLTSKTEGTDSWVYTWNAENQLTKVEKNGVEIARLSYDPLGRRVEKVAGGVTTSYTYEGGNTLRELRGSINLKYVHGMAADEPLAVEDGTVLSYLHADGLGSVVRTTSAAGAVTLTRQYHAWGNLQAGAGEPGYAFTGREWDPETELYYYRARYYDADAGRFASEDPIGLRGGINYYAYVHNRPADETDPTGLESGRTFSGLWGNPGPNERMRPPYPPMPGSCGSGGNQPYVPEGIGGVSFTPCCEQHDRCYSTCGASRQCCDVLLYSCVLTRCHLAGQSSRERGRPTLCEVAGFIYLRVVQKEGGDAFNDAQGTACKR